MVSPTVYNCKIIPSDLVLRQNEFTIVSYLLCFVKKYFMYKSEAGTFSGKVYIL